MEVIPPLTVLDHRLSVPCKADGTAPRRMEAWVALRGEMGVVVSGEHAENRAYPARTGGTYVKKSNFYVRVFA